jgi:hypothetical protein
MKLSSSLKRWKIWPLCSFCTRCTVCRLYIGIVLKCHKVVHLWLDLVASILAEKFCLMDMISLLDCLCLPFFYPRPHDPCRFVACCLDCFSKVLHSLILEVIVNPKVDRRWIRIIPLLSSLHVCGLCAIGSKDGSLHLDVLRSQRRPFISL